MKTRCQNAFELAPGKLMDRNNTLCKVNPVKRNGNTREAFVFLRAVKMQN
jgi:hypothetical protein